MIDLGSFDKEALARRKLPSLMAPKRKCHGEVQMDAERIAKIEGIIFRNPKSPIAIHMRNFSSNRHLPLDVQIQLQLKPLVEDGLLGSSFYDPIASLPRLRSYELIRESVYGFLREAEVLCNDLKEHMGRWDPDLKSAAVAAKGIAGIAQSICMDEMVGLGKVLEAKCLSGNDPFVIFGLCHRVRDFYQSVHYRLIGLLILLNKALGDPPAADPSSASTSADGLSSAPPPTTGPSEGPS